MLLKQGVGLRPWSGIESVLLTALVDTTPEEEAAHHNRVPDVFAIGFEEIVDLNATNIVQNTQWSENAASWGKELQKVSATEILDD